MVPETFAYLSNVYNTIVRFPYGILGIRKLDSCCEDLVLIKRTGDPERVVGEAKTARAKLIRTAAEFCTVTSEAYHNKESSDTVWVIPDGQQIPVFTPKFVPGTSGGSNYRTLALTRSGSVSYCHGELTGPHRMRVALWPELVTGAYLWSSEDKKLSAKFPGLTFATIEHTHMSYTSQNINQATAVLARGLDVLLHVQTLL